MVQAEALNTLHKLITHGYMRGDTVFTAVVEKVTEGETNDEEDPSSLDEEEKELVESVLGVDHDTATATGDETEAKTTDAAGEGGETVVPEDTEIIEWMLSDEIIDGICACIDSDDDEVLLQIIKVIISAVTSPVMEVSTDSILFNPFLFTLRPYQFGAFVFQFEKVCTYLESLPRLFPNRFVRCCITIVFLDSWSKLAELYLYMLEPVYRG